MATLTHTLPFEGTTNLRPTSVRSFVREMIEATGVSLSTLAQGVAMPESQLSRMISKKGCSVRPQTIQPLRRIAVLVDAVRQTLSEKGAREWLSMPNPYLDDVPPILHLRSDKELERTLALLAAIQHGFPA